MVHLYLQVNTTIAMRAPLLCTCASHCFAHARPIALHMPAPLYRARPQFANMRPGLLHGKLQNLKKKKKGFFTAVWVDTGKNNVWFVIS